VIIISTLLALSSASTQSAEMRPLLEAMKANSVEQAVAYAGRRCTALYLGMHSRFAKSGRPDIDELTQDLWNKYMSWMKVGFALTLRERENNGDGITFFESSVRGIAEGYGDVWNRNSDLTGSLFGEMTNQDDQVCTMLYEELK